MSKGSSVIVRSNAVRSCSFAVVLAPSISDDTGGAQNDTNNNNPDH